MKIVMEYKKRFLQANVLPRALGRTLAGRNLFLVRLLEIPDNLESRMRVLGSDLYVIWIFSVFDVNKE